MTFVGEHVLEGDLVTVGRSNRCTLSLHDPQKLLSRVQVEFARVVTGYRLKVVSTHSGVRVNGHDYGPGSEVDVGVGDAVAMDGFELEIADMWVQESDPDATIAVGNRMNLAASARAAEEVSPRPAVEAPVPRPVPQPPVVRPRTQVPTAAAPAEVVVIPASPAPSPVLASVPLPAKRPPFLARGTTQAGIGVAVACVIAAFLLMPALKGLSKDPAEEKKADQEIARLEGESRSLLKLIESDRQELKESVAGAQREIERLKGQAAAARTNQERESIDASMLDALQTARMNSRLERALRDSAENPGGIPKAEGNLSAAAVAAKGGDKAGAIKLLGETVASLTRIRSSFVEERKTALAEQLRRREELKVAETRAKTDADTRAKADAEALGKAKARAQAESAARAKEEAESRARAESAAQAREEAAAKARAESEARIKAEADARVRESEARVREIEARTKAESEARIRAENEARARREAADRAREAAAARASAEAEARAKRQEEREQAEQVFRIIRGFAR